VRLAATAGSDPANCAIDVWVPGDSEPRLTTTGVADAAYQKVPGGWRVIGCARGSYSITTTT
jgi:hypothetical protein